MHVPWDYCQITTFARTQIVTLKFPHQVRELVEEEAASNSCSTVLGSSGPRNGSGGHRLPDMMATMNVVDVLPQVRWAAEALLATLGRHQGC